MKILVAYGSRRGSTADLARTVTDAFRERGHAVDYLPAGEVHSVTGYDAVVLGGALYMHRWVHEAGCFVRRHLRQLRTRPVWMFSSGPLDDSANKRAIPPVPSVARIMKRVGARGHATFGGRLAPDAHGFPAAAMAKAHAGDWRDWDQVRAWVHDIARDLELAPARSGEVPRPVHRSLAILCFAVGISALCGGLGLVVRPDGALLHMPSSYLEHTPFSTYLIPGLLLLGVIGLGSLSAGVLVVRRDPNANAIALGASAALGIWIVSEMVLLRTASWLQLGFLGIAIAIGFEARRRARMPARTRPQYSV